MIFDIRWNRQSIFRALKIQIHQNYSKFREAFWSLGGRPERPEEPLEDPKGITGSIFRPQWVPQPSKMFTFHNQINFFWNAAKSLLGKSMNPTSAQRSSEVTPSSLQWRLRALEGTKKNILERTIHARDGSTGGERSDRGGAAISNILISHWRIIDSRYTIKSTLDDFR